MNKKILILMIGMILLIGIVFAGDKFVDGTKIKDIKELDCNKKYDPDKCKNEKKIKIDENNPLKAKLIDDTKTGKEVIHIWSEGL